jgi:2-aminomuconate deaminase
MSNTTSGALKRIAINIPEKAPSPLGSYSHAVQAGPFIYLSGQGARDPETGKEVGVTLNENGDVTSYDIEVQTHAVIRNMRIILEAAGCSLNDLIDVSVFLAEIKDFAKFNKVYAEYFSFEGAPARTTVQAAGLPGKNFIEIKAIALNPRG